MLLAVPIARAPARALWVFAGSFVKVSKVVSFASLLSSESVYREAAIPDQCMILNRSPQSARRYTPLP